MGQHYPLEAWIDFVRGLTPDTERLLMQAHRAECEGCADVVRLFESVRETAVRDRAELVPSGAAERAFRILPMQSPAEPAWRRELAKLLDDSLDGALPAGVRSLRGSTRQLRYRADEFEIDLDLEPSGDAAESVSITGQVLRHRPAFGTWGGAEFRLLADNQEVLRGVANALGEFEAKCALHPDLRLQLADKDRRVLVEVPLGTILRSGPSGPA